jgi:hypothetical protein
VRLALKETSHGAGLRRRLGEMRRLGAAAGPEELWLVMEEAVNEITKLQVRPRLILLCDDRQ